MSCTKLAAFALLAVLVSCSPKHIPAPGTTPVRPPAPKPTPQGEALSPFTLLRKISLHLRGQTPSAAEYAALGKAIEKDEVKEFLQKKVDTYLTSDQHIDKMTFRLEELFALKASGVSFHGPLAGLGGNNRRGRQPPFHDYPLNNSMNDLFRQMISRNLSWDTLLTGHRYRAFPLKDERDTYYNSDHAFFAAAAGTPAHADQVTPVDFAEGDARVAGVLTTGRFFNRYVNTALNKNRRRAAAVFRVFLCDDMKAVVVDEKGNVGQVLDKVFPGGLGGGPGQGGLGDPHGSDPACMKCHYKLDPMGQTFQNSGYNLAPLASPGALVFTSSRGQKVEVQAAGIGEMAHAITQQEDYVRCQVKHFWRWFVGEDKPLDESTLSELTAKFNQVKRRPNDFISHLMSRPEFGFTNAGGGNEVLVTQVKTILKNCNGCHALEGVPSFSDWPIDGDETRHQRWLTSIRRSLSLDGSTRPRTMPPSSSSWQPSPAELATLQQWYDLGAPNE